MPQNVELSIKVEEVFATEGVPRYNFVPPPNYGEILIDIRRPGKPVIIEGQSGTGKTTCVLKILEELSPNLIFSYLRARVPEDVNKIKTLAQAPTAGTYVIDDFHRLAPDLQVALADLAKISAERPDEADTLPKLVLIGINQVGSGLIQLVPDIAKRIGIHRIKAGTPDDISRLVQAGCAQLNIKISGVDTLYSETQGDYWLTQQLCQSVCVSNRVYERCADSLHLDINLVELSQIVVEKLRNSYYPAVKEFCRGRRFRPSNDPYFKLLRAVSSQESSIVDLNELANTSPEFRGSINNIKEHRLRVLLDEKPLCAKHFYYNAETKTFALEDPALFYFIRHLNWESLRRDCGFRADSREYEYDIALSFAGENRELASYIAEQMNHLDVPIFYDRYYESNFLGQAWSKHFQRIFLTDSRIVVCILDKNHKEKIWPTFERECFVPRVVDGAVIPIFLDDTRFPGIPSDIVGIKFAWSQTMSEWQDKVNKEIIFKIIDRLDKVD